MAKFVVLCAVLASACSSRPAPDPVALGDETFRTMCARCHGANGDGGLPMTPEGTRPRDLSDPAWQASRTDVDIEYIVRQGKLPMPSFKDALTPEQIAAVVGKVRRLNKGAKQ